MPWNDIAKIRAAGPLIHNITNYVVMNTTANALLALGASPVMAHDLDEVEEMVGYAGALVLNIGTLSPRWVEAMFKAGKEAGRRGVPIVLDPVGAGATRLRTATCLRLLEGLRPAIVRGNASEIRALGPTDAGTAGTTKGVDSTERAEDLVDITRAVARKHGCVVSMSGATDVVTDGASVLLVKNGHPMMPRVTGLGCTASALTGAFAAVNPDRLRAAAHAMVVSGIAGELAAERSPGPGSFQVNFLDALYSLTEGEVARRSRLEPG